MKLKKILEKIKSKKDTESSGHMRLAFVVNNFPKLSETFILNQIIGLKERGYHVDIYASALADKQKIHREIEQYDLLNHTFYYEGLLFMVRNLFFKKKNYDVIICHFGPNGYKGLLFKKLGFINGKIVTFFHGYDMSEVLKSKGNHFYDELFEKSDLFLPVSDFFKNKFISFGYDPKKIIVHRMGVDCEKFNISPNNTKKNDKIQILTISRLVEKKGIKYSIIAVSNLLNKGYKIKYTIIGDGPEKEQLKKLIDSLGVREDIEIMGAKNHVEILEFFKEAEIFVSSNVTAEDGNTEGIPVAIMEAMACKLPVVTTNHTGIPELVLDNESGFLVNEKDVASTAEKIEFLINNPKKRIEMGDRGRNIVKEKYNIEKLNNDFIKIIKSLSE